MFDPNVTQMMWPPPPSVGKVPPPSTFTAATVAGKAERIGFWTGLRGFLRPMRRLILAILPEKRKEQSNLNTRRSQ
jgi:hypothetical protein